MAFKIEGCKFISVEENDYIYENYLKKDFNIDSINKNKDPIQPNNFNKQTSLYDFQINTKLTYYDYIQLKNGNNLSINYFSINISLIKHT